MHMPFIPSVSRITSRLVKSVIQLQNKRKGTEADLEIIPKYLILVGQWNIATIIMLHYFICNYAILKLCTDVSMYRKMYLKCSFIIIT